MFFLFLWMQIKLKYYFIKIYIKPFIGQTYNIFISLQSKLLKSLKKI